MAFEERDNISENEAKNDALEDEQRAAKIASIREQLAKGSYNISGKDVADKIISLIKS